MPGSAGSQLSQSGNWGLEDEVLGERAYPLLPLAGLKSVARTYLHSGLFHPVIGPVLDTLKDHSGYWIP